MSIFHPEITTNWKSATILTLYDVYLGSTQLMCVENVWYTCRLLFILQDVNSISYYQLPNEAENSNWFNETRLQIEGCRYWSLGQYHPCCHLEIDWWHRHSQRALFTHCCGNFEDQWNRHEWELEWIVHPLHECLPEHF